MGYELYREVKDHAPADLDTGELALLLILADDANDQTRECFPGMDEICRWMRMGADGVGRVLQRLAKHGLEVRVPVGEDRTGRTIYAKKGVQTTYRLPRFKTSMPGPQSDHNANGRTPVRPKTGSRPDASPGIEAPWPDAGQSMGGPQSGPSPQSPQEEDPHLSPVRRIVRSTSVVAEEEEERFIEWMTTTYKPKSSAWWRTVAASGDMPTRAAEWRQETAQSAPRAPNGLPDWCGACGGESGDVARFNARFRTINGKPCPQCHPLRPQHQPKSAPQPYRNPDDQSVYFEGIR